MPLEEGVLTIIMFCFYGLILCVLLIVISMTIRKEKKDRTPYIFMILHLIFLVFAGTQLFGAISNNPNHPMASEEMSIKLTISTLVWVFGMAFFMLGLLRFNK